jgi:hypothetical protein
MHTKCLLYAVNHLSQAHYTNHIKPNRTETVYISTSKFFFSLFFIYINMDSEKRQIDRASTFSHKEETRIETLTDQNDRITTSSLESQEQPKLKRSLKARHLAVSSNE